MTCPLQHPRVAVHAASRTTTRVVLLWLTLLACPSFAFAQNCTSAELTLVNAEQPDLAPDSNYRLGSLFAVRLTGACVTDLMDALRKQPVNESVTLYLNRIPMEGLPVQRQAVENSTDVLLVFTLSRDPSDDVKRSAWDQFLGSHEEAGFNVKAGLRVAGGAVVALAPRPSTFGVASNSTINGTLVAGLAFVFGAFILLAMKSGALLDDHGYFSLGRAQMTFWALLVFAATCSLWFITWTLEPIPDAILSLLGISVLTGLGSVAIESSKSTGTRGAKNRSGKRRRLGHFLADITNDGTGMSIHRLQAVVWTLFLGWVFVRSVATVISMPSFDGSLLILMGISSGTYLGFKFPEKSSAEQATDTEPPTTQT